MFFVWKKCRKGEVNEIIASRLIDKFDADAKNFSFIPDNYEIKQLAKSLIASHWKLGLRTLDSMQLASGIIIRENLNFYFTSDVLLAEIAKKEGLNVK